MVKTYDAWALELVAKQKCYYHIIRSIDKVLEDKAGSARALGGTLKTLLKDAIALWKRYHARGVPGSLDGPDNQRLLVVLNM